MTTGAQEVNDRGRASTLFCRRVSRIIDSRGTLTSKDPYEHCATVIPIHNGVCRIATECSPSTCLWEVSYVLLLTLVIILTIIIITDSQNTISLRVSESSTNTMMYCTCINILSL